MNVSIFYLFDREVVDITIINTFIYTTDVLSKIPVRYFYHNVSGRLNFHQSKQSCFLPRICQTVL